MKKFKELTKLEKEEFTKEFYNIWEFGDEDFDSPCPWGCPWEFLGNADYQAPKEFYEAQRNNILLEMQETE